jgi:hypothetical protein
MDERFMAGLYITKRAKAGLLILCVFLLAAPYVARGQQMKVSPLTAIAADRGTVSDGHVDLPPSLTEVERLKAQIAVLEYKRTQAEFKLAQRAAQDATAALLQMVKALSRDGYEFDLETLTYSPKPPTPAPTP